MFAQYEDCFLETDAGDGAGDAPRGAASCTHPIRRGETMDRWTTLVAGLAALLAFGLSAQGTAAVDFEPFSEVESVCPDCELPDMDTVELSSGEKIRCQIVAANDDFWVIERYGEVRAIPDSRVTSKSYADGGAPSDLRSQDQIVLENGHVLTGAIVDESDEPGHFQLKSSVGDSSFVVFKKQARAMYRDGSKATVETAE
jgi:hypothetical protein